MKKMRALPSRMCWAIGVKAAGMGASKVVTRRFVQAVPVAMRSEKVKASSKVLKATTHWDQLTAGVRVSQILVMMPLVPQAWRTWWMSGAFEMEEDGCAWFPW